MISGSNDFAKSSWVVKNPKKTGVLITIFVLAVGLFIMDRIIKAVDPPPPEKRPETVRAISLREHHPGLNKIINPSDYYLSTTDNLIDQDYQFRIDNNGFLLPHNTHDNPDQTIVFIGGSTAECMYVAENSRFPYLAGEILEDKHNKLINSYNAAAAGNSSIHSLGILLNKVIPLDPDIVVIMHAINDYAILAYDHTYWPVGTTRSELITINDFFPQQEKETFFWHFKGLFRSIYPYFYQKLFEIKNRILNPPVVTEPWDEWAGRRHFIKDRDFKFMQKEFKWSLQMLITACKTHDIIPVMMTQANRYKTEPDDFIIESMSKMLNAGIDYDTFKKEYDIFNQIIRDIAKSNNIRLIDLAKLVPQEKEYMYDVMHYNDKGSKYVAEIIADHLAPYIANK